MKIVGWRQLVPGVAMALAWASTPSCKSPGTPLTSGTSTGATSTGATSSGAGGASGGGGSMNGPVTSGGLGSACDPDPFNDFITHPTCCGGQCVDFPVAPVLADTSVPSNPATLFGASFTPGSLCVLEPQLSSGATEGAMIPANWVMPRFRWVAPAGINLFELRLHTPAEKTDLVVYTTGTEYYPSADVWSKTAGNIAGTPITVTLRGIDSATPGMVPVGVTGDFNVAPVAAKGGVIFFQASSEAVTPTSSQLGSFVVGDTATEVAVSLGQVAWSGQPGEDGAALRGYGMPLAGFTEGQVRCTGCHAVTPDATAVAFTDSYPWVKGAAYFPWAGDTSHVPSQFPAPSYAGPTTFTFGAGAQSMFKSPWWGSQTMSPAHWQRGDAILVSSYGTSFQGAPPAFATGSQRTMPWQALPSYDPTSPLLDDRVNYHQLAWIDMESTATIDVAFPAQPDSGQALTMREMQAEAAMGTTWGLIPTGDTLSDVMPSMSNLAATDTIAYVESDFTPDGHPDATATMASIRTVPYNHHAGGTSQPLQGASDPGHLNYYPSYSADDELIAFVQAPLPGASSPDGPYYNRFGQVMIVPAAGGTPLRLAANDPNACAGDDVSKGIVNSWPSWSPDAVVHPNGKTYYFLVFSSARLYGDEFGQQFTVPSDPSSSFTGLRVSSQIYLAAVVIDGTTKEITTYPAVYVWNQNRTPGGGNGGQGPYSNLTPTWARISPPPIE